jgi:putative ABC transport system substrate-binding protein
VHKILQGSKLADLPIEQPTKVELVIDVQAAKALDLKIAAAFLVRADKLIE